MRRQAPTALHPRCSIRPQHSRLCECGAHACSGMIRVSDREGSPAEKRLPLAANTAELTPAATNAASAQLLHQVLQRNCQEATTAPMQGSATGCFLSRVCFQPPLCQACIWHRDLTLGVSHAAGGSLVRDNGGSAEADAPPCARCRGVERAHALQHLIRRLSGSRLFACDASGSFRPPTALLQCVHGLVECVSHTTVAAGAFPRPDACTTWGIEWGIE